MPITMQCNPDTPGAEPDNFHGKELFTLTTHHGLVLSLFERNGYDDSDFCAVVWNPEKAACETITYASTRGWTYANGATIDATPEVVAAARAWNETERAKILGRIKNASALIPAIGDTVTVKITRGKNKIFNGKNGRVFWIGDGYGYNAPPRAGVEIDGQKVFFNAANLYAAPATSWAEGIQELKAAQYWANHAPNVLFYSI